MIKRRLRKKTMRAARDRPTTFERAKREHHGSVQVLPGVGGEFIKVKGAPGKKQVIKWWNSEGVRKQEWVERGIQNFRPIAGKRTHKVNKGEKRTWYNKKGAFSATYSVKRKVKQPVALMTPGDAPEADSVIVGKPYIKETHKSHSRAPGSRRKSKRTRKIPLTK